MEIVSYRCLYAETYYRAVSGQKETYWVFSQNCFGETACLLWCHLFNSRNNDPVHYWRLFGNDQLVPLSTDFGYEIVRARLRTAAGLDEAGYETFRNQVVAFRNQYISHREYELGSITFPDLRRVAAMCSELRVILQRTVLAELEADRESAELNELLVHYEASENSEVIAKAEGHAKAALGAGGPQDD
jgi:hypothetical protein